MLSLVTLHRSHITLSLIRCDYTGTGAFCATVEPLACELDCSCLGCTFPATAASASCCAHSLPLKVAPSIEARYFCFVKQPAMKKLLMGVVCPGLKSSLLVDMQAIAKKSTKCHTIEMNEVQFTRCETTENTVRTDILRNVPHWCSCRGSLHGSRSVRQTR